jgi:benzoyl-CoA reductase/2-hydroxyglutaryl-CoA dehydratase subunit BcrC/BadD/HgdB
MVYFPHMADPAVTGVVEDLGLAIAVTTRSGVWDKVPSPYDSIWEKAADQNLRRGSRHSTASMINELKDIARTYQVDGLILDVLAKCRVHTFYPLKAKEVIEKELGIPVLVIEHDHYDTRDYSAEHYQSRIEPFAEILKARKAAKVK